MSGITVPKETISYNFIFITSKIFMDANAKGTNINAP